MTQAQNADILQQCTALSDFLTEVYLDEELDRITSYNIDGTEKTALEKIMQAHSNWFYSNGSYNYVLSEYTHKDLSGVDKVDFLMLRLININGMKNDLSCSDIIKQLNGGYADLNGDGIGDDEAYQYLKDVYGVTDDLQVYYCSSGLETVKGADYTNTSFLDGTKVIYNSSSGISKAIAETKGIESTDQTLSSLRSNTELVISNLSGLNDLNCMYDLPNITKLTLKNYKGSLNGLEKAYKLKWLYLRNEDGNFHISDWSGIKGVTGLKEIYFYMPTDDEADGLCSAMSTVDYTNLTTFGLYGHLNEIGNSYKMNRASNSWRASFSNSNGSIEKLSDKTKEKIVTLYLGNASISGNLDLSKFTKLSHLYLGCNNMTSFPTFPTVTSTKTYYVIDMAYNNLTTINLPNKINSTYLYLEGNSITSLVNIINHGVTLCVATSISTLDFSSLTTSEKDSLQAINIRLDSKYALVFPTYETTVPTSTTNEEFLQMANSSNVKKLNLSGCNKIDNTTLQSVLSTLTLDQINLDNTKIENLDCLKNSDLICLSIRGTHIGDLTPILSKNIALLRVNDVSAIVDFYNSETEEYKAKAKLLFQEIANNNGGSSSNPTFDSWGNRGLCTDSGSDLALLINTFEITNAYCNYENSNYSGNIDISLSKVSTVKLDYTMNSSSVFLPNSITGITLERAGGTISCSSSEFSFAESNQSSEILNLTNANLSNVVLTTVLLRGTNAINSTWKNIKINTLKYLGFNYSEPSYGSSKLNSRLNSITINALDNENLTTNIDTIYINQVNCNSLTSLNRFIKTENFYIWNCDIESFGNFLTKNTVVKKLYLTKNLITEVTGLENGINIEELDLSNNQLTNYSTMGTGTKLTGDVIAELPKLKYVKLQGNNDLTNFGKLSDTTIWKNDGYNNFTKITTD